MTRNEEAVHTWSFETLRYISISGPTEQTWHPHVRFSCNRKIGRKERELRKEERGGTIHPTQGTSLSEAVRIEKGWTVIYHGVAIVVPYPTSRRQWHYRIPKAEVWLVRKLLCKCLVHVNLSWTSTALRLWLLAHYATVAHNSLGGVVRCRATQYINPQLDRRFRLIMGILKNKMFVT